MSRKIKQIKNHVTSKERLERSRSPNGSERVSTSRGLANVCNKSVLTVHFLRFNWRLAKHLERFNHHVTRFLNCLLLFRITKYSTTQISCCVVDISQHRVKYLYLPLNYEKRVTYYIGYSIRGKNIVVNIH